MARGEGWRLRYVSRRIRCDRRGNVFDRIEGGRRKGSGKWRERKKEMRGSLRCVARLCIVRGSMSLGLRVC